MSVEKPQKNLKKGLNVPYDILLDSHLTQRVLYHIDVSQYSHQNQNILFISDLHMGRQDGKKIEFLKELQDLIYRTKMEINAILLGGDFVNISDPPEKDSLQKKLEPALQILQKIPSQKRFAVFGNHDEHWQDSSRSWLRKIPGISLIGVFDGELYTKKNAEKKKIIENILEQNGFENMENRSSLNSLFSVHGFPDYSSGNTNIREKKISKDTLSTILLTHNLDGFNSETHKVDLVLSGHWHAGEFYPFGIPIGIWKLKISQLISGKQNYTNLNHHDPRILAKRGNRKKETNAVSVLNPGLDIKAPFCKRRGTLKAGAVIIKI